MIILAATPIGNLGDASVRLVGALEAATVIASTPLSIEKGFTPNSFDAAWKVSLT